MMIKEIALRPFFSNGDWVVDYRDEVGARRAIFDTWEQAVAWIKSNRLSLREQLQESLDGPIR